MTTEFNIEAAERLRDYLGFSRLTSWQIDMILDAIFGVDK